MNSDLVAILLEKRLLFCVLNMHIKQCEFFNGTLQVLPLYYVGMVYRFTGVFHLVEFTETKTVAVISSSWLVNNDKCCYSTSLDASKIAQLARRHVSPAVEWEIFDIRIKKTAG